MLVFSGRIKLPAPEHPLQVGIPSLYRMCPWFSHQNESAVMQDAILFQIVAYNGTVITRCSTTIELCVRPGQSMHTAAASLYIPSAACYQLKLDLSESMDTEWKFHSIYSPSI